MSTFDETNLPENPHGHGFVDAHGPRMRFARVRELEEPFTLIDPGSGTRYEMPAGGFLVLEKGSWRAEERDAFLDHWELALGDWGVSAIEEEIEVIEHRHGHDHQPE
jgi:hypothetical protein